MNDSPNPQTAVDPEWGLLSEQFTTNFRGRSVRVSVYSKRVDHEGEVWMLFTAVDADTNEVINAEVSPV